MLALFFRKKNDRLFFNFSLLAMTCVRMRKNALTSVSEAATICQLQLMPPLP
jgi:hypothetical protein